MSPRQTGSSTQSTLFSGLQTFSFGCVTRAAVPLFLMCSGLLFFDPSRELDSKKLYTRYLPRVIVAMFAWSMLYKTVRLLYERVLTLGSFFQAIKEVLVFDQEFHFYYLHMILIFYIFTPIVRVFTSHAEKNRWNTAWLYGLYLAYCIPP